MTTGVRRKICGLCGQDKVWVGSELVVRVRVCRACDSPQVARESR